MKKWIAAFCFMFLGTANASLITETHNITAAGENSVGYTFFEVITAGTFNIYTMGPTIDPVLILFHDDGNLDLTDLIDSNDDSCPDSFCGPAGSWSNAILSDIFLNGGFYVAVISDFGFSTNEAISGSNTNNLTGLASINIDVSPNDSTGARATLSTRVPEPSTLLLFGMSILGFAGMRRRA